MYTFFADISAADVGTWILGLSTVLLIAEKIRSLLSKEPGDRYITQTEFSELKKDVELLDQKIAATTSKREFRERIAVLNKQQTANADRIIEVRLSIETLYRNINNDVQNLIGKMVDRIEANQRLVLKSLYRDKDNED